MEAKPSDGAAGTNVHRDLCVRARNRLLGLDLIVKRLLSRSRATDMNAFQPKAEMLKLRLDQQASSLAIRQDELQATSCAAAVASCLVNT